MGHQLPRRHSLSMAARPSIAVFVNCVFLPNCSLGGQDCVILMADPQLRMERRFVKLCCAAVVQVPNAKVSRGNRASTRSAACVAQTGRHPELIGTLPVKAIARLGPNSWAIAIGRKNQERNYAYCKPTCGCFRCWAFCGIRIASLGATGRESAATFDRPWPRTE